MVLNRLYETANHQSLLKNNYKKRGTREPNNLAVRLSAKALRIHMPKSTLELKSKQNYDFQYTVIYLTQQNKISKLQKEIHFQRDEQNKKL